MMLSLQSLSIQRHDGRHFDQLRAIKLSRGFTSAPEGSVLIEVGNTRVICTATVEEKTPPFCKEEGHGWITAEYSMLPRATQQRTSREATKGHQSGRTMEIQRLIGRSLRGVVDLTALGERTVTLDCDVIQADGGTRVASITGAFVAMYDAINGLIEQGILTENPIQTFVAAISVGIVDGVPVLDLDYHEDSSCGTDLNAVMTENGEFIELQGTAEGAPFSKESLAQMLTLAESGIRTLISIQKEALGIR